MPNGERKIARKIEEKIFGKKPELKQQKTATKIEAQVPPGKRENEKEKRRKMIRGIADLIEEEKDEDSRGYLKFVNAAKKNKTVERKFFAQAF